MLLLLKTTPYFKYTTLLVYFIFTIAGFVTTISYAPVYTLVLKNTTTATPLLMSFLLTIPGLNLITAFFSFIIVMRIWFFKTQPNLLSYVLSILLIKNTAMVFKINSCWPDCSAQDNLLLSNALNTIHPPALYSSGIILTLCVSGWFFCTTAIKLNILFEKYYCVITLLKNLPIMVLLPLIALVLGCFWANQVGTWGGWWANDPSELLIISLTAVVIATYHWVLIKRFFVQNLTFYTTTVFYIFLNQFLCFKFLDSTLHSFFTNTQTSLNLLQLSVLLFLGAILVSQTKGQIFWNWLKKTTLIPHKTLPYSLVFWLTLTPFLPWLGASLTDVLLVNTLLSSLLFQVSSRGRAVFTKVYHLLAFYTFLWLLLGLYRLDFVFIDTSFAANLTSIKYNTISFVDKLICVSWPSIEPLFAFNSLYLYYFNSFTKASFALISPLLLSPDWVIYTFSETLICLLSLMLVFVFLCSLKTILIG